jgi:hypothetical protein
MTQAFNLSQLANKVNTSGQLDVATGVTGIQAIANGGTGASSLTGNSVAITNSGGTALSTVAAGTTGNVLTSNGTTWISQAASGGQFQTELFTAPGTWTKPASCSQVRVTVIGGGGGGRTTVPGAQPGGMGGIAISQAPVSAPVSVTIGSGGGGGSAGGTSSFGPIASATGGAAGSSVIGAPGSGTVSVGTALRSGSTYVSAANENASVGVILGLSRNPPSTPATAYSASGLYMAGAGGGQFTGVGSAGGGIGGAVLVEYVG